MTWGAPERIALITLAPVVAAAGWWWWRRTTHTLGAWAARAQWTRLGIDASRRRLAGWLASAFIAVACIGLAAAQPRWGQSEMTVERVGVDTVVILDSSSSMTVSDVTPSRLEVAGALLARMTERLDGHRVALLQVEGTVRALTPMTADMEAVRLAIDTVEAGSLERPGTDLGLALERAAEMFLPGEERHRALLIVTDGEDHGRRVAEATRLLVDESVTVHVMAVGTQQGGPIPVIGGGPGVYKQDAEGNVVISRLAGESLRELAESTGGTLVTIDRAGQSVDPIVDAVLELEARSLGTDTVTQQKERFQIPLLVGILALIAMTLVPPLKPSRSAA